MAVGGEGGKWEVAEIGVEKRTSLVRCEVIGVLR